MTYHRYFQSSFAAIVLMCSFVLLPVDLSHAGLNRWTTHGPAGGPISAIAIDPKTPTTLYVGTPGAGLFKSTDGGTQWTAKGEGLTDASIYAIASINTIAIDPLTPTTLYIGTDAGVFKSVDAGETWIAVYTGFLPFPVEPSFAPITALAIDPQTPTTLYAGGGGSAQFGSTGGNLIKSTDGGGNWTKIENGLSDAETMIRVAAFAIDPLTPTTLYVAINRIEAGGGPFPPHPVPHGLFKSVDGGESWTRLQEDFGFIYALVIDPVTPTTLYAGTGNGIFRSTDGGSQWAPLKIGIEGTSVSTIVVDQTNPARLYAGTDRGVFKSTNSGTDWEPINTGLPTTSVHTLALDPASPPTLYVGTDEGLYKSADGGLNWQVSDTGIANADVYTLLLDPTAPTTLYTNISQGTSIQLLKSTNGGKLWEVLPPSPLAPELLIKAIIPTTPATIYALTADRAVPPRNDLLKSQDGGQSWEVVSGDLPVHSLVVDPQTPTRLYAYGGFGVLRSTDGGKNWTSHNSGLPDLQIGAFAIDPITPTTLYLSSGPNGIFKSTDSGDSWVPINNGLPPGYFSPLVVDPTSPNILYALPSSPVSEGSQLLLPIFKSIDVGATWQRVSALIDPPVAITGLVIDPMNSRTLYAATLGQGVLKSADGGISWAPMNIGLSNPSVFTLAIDPINGRTLYAGISRGGVFDFEIGSTAVDLAITQQGSPDPVFRGADLSYALTITNNGPSTVSGAQVHDTLSWFGVDLLSATPSQGRCQQTALVVCDLGPLASGASASVQIVVKPRNAGELSNTVSVTGIEPDPVTANNVVRITTTVVPPPGPDLIGTWLRVEQKCKKGNTGQQQCKIKGRLVVQNQGVHDAPASTLQVLSLVPIRFSTPQLLAQFTLPPLKAGKKKKFKMTVFSPERANLSGQSLSATLDAGNIIDEMHEDNNFVSATIP